MREYLTNIVAVTFLAAISEMIMPSGKIQKYASCILGIAITLCILSPLINITPNISLEDIFSEYSSEIIEEEYKQMVNLEFEKKTGEKIKSISGNIDVKVKADDCEIQSVEIFGSPDIKTINYIIADLGVKRSNVEIYQ